MLNFCLHPASRPVTGRKSLIAECFLLLLFTHTEVALLRILSLSSTSGIVNLNSHCVEGPGTSYSEMFRKIKIIII